MPITPNPLERLVLLQANAGPAPVLDIFGAAAFWAVHAGVELGVFDALGGGSLAPVELAARLSIDARGAAVLLDTLAALRYVDRRAGRYANSAWSAKWLVRDAPLSVASGVEYWGIIFRRFWHELPEAIRSGRHTDLYNWIEDQPAASRAFQEWMVAAARIGGAEVVSAISLPPDARHVLDVGGGHGMYSVALCRKHPQLQATIFDSPRALEAAHEHIPAEGMSGRITTQTGDFLTGSLGDGYDVALLINIVHGFMPEQNAALLRRVAAALRPGGVVVVGEQVAGTTRRSAGGQFAELLGLAYYLLLGGQIYDAKAITGWLHAAGFGYVRRRNLLRVPGNSVFMGTKA